MSAAGSTSVSIAGVGMVSGYGIGAQRCLEGLLRAEPAAELEHVESWPAPDRVLPVAAPDRDLIDSVLHGQQLRALNMEARMTLAACFLAIEDAGYDLDDLSDESTGVVVAVQQSGLQDYGDLLWAGMKSENGMVSPTRGPLAGFNAAAGFLGIRAGISGPNATVLNGMVGGVDALLYAMDALSAGELQKMLVCGVSVVSPLEVSMLAEDEADWGPRPFDVDRGGASFGNVAVALLVEREGRKAARATVTGAHAAFSPAGDMEDAMLRALLGVKGEERVAACFAGANGSLVGDAIEAGVVSAILDHDVPVSAIKGGIGECFAASILAQVAIATLSIDSSVLPPTPGFGKATGLLRLPIPPEPQPLPEGILLIHSWDPAGAAGAVAVRGN